MKTSELTGALLDYWVAQAEGMLRMVTGSVEERLGGFSPSTKWAHGGPIIERDCICMVHYGNVWGAHIWPGSESWIDTDVYEADGTAATPLVAAMRAYVASKFGDEVPDDSPVGGKSD